MAENAGAEKKTNTSGILTAIGCCFILSCIGGCATTVNINVPGICEGLGITTVQVAVEVIVSAITAFVCGLLGTKFLTFLTPRWSMFVGVIAAAAALFVIAWTDSYIVFVCAGLLSGFSLACSFPPIAQLMNIHFKKDSGKWFGLSTGAQVFVVAGIIKLEGTMLTTNDYRFVMFAIGTAALVIGLLCCLFLVKQPKRSVLLEQAKEAAAKAAEAKAKREQLTDNDPMNQGLSVAEALKKPSLYLFGLGMIAGAIITGSMSTYGSTFFVMFGMTKADAADMMSLYTLFCGIHVLWTGFFQAKVGSKIFILTQYIVIIIGAVLLMLWPSSNTIILAVVGLFLVAFIKPINSTPALLLPDLFGRKYYLELNSLSNGIYYGGICLSSATTSVIMTALGGVTAFLYLGAMAVVACVVFLSAIALSPMKKLLKKVPAEASPEVPAEESLPEANQEAQKAEE